MPIFDESDEPSPFRRPDWRSGQVAAVLQTIANCSASFDDSLTQTSLTRQEAPDSRGEFQPDSLKNCLSFLQQAQAIFQERDKVRLHLEACLLARMSAEQIAAATGVHPGVIRAFEFFFFDCRPCLDATDWVVFQAIGPCTYLRSLPQVYGILLKRIAYFRGALFLRTATPYLLHGLPLFENLDTTTIEGRTRLHAELAIAIELLPLHGRQGRMPTVNIALLHDELDRRRSGPMESLSENAFRLLHVWAQAKQWEAPQASRKVWSSQKPTTTRKRKQRAQVS